MFCSQRPVGHSRSAIRANDQHLSTAEQREPLRSPPSDIRSGHARAGLGGFANRLRRRFTANHRSAAFRSRLVRLLLADIRSAKLRAEFFGEFTPRVAFGLGARVVAESRICCSMAIQVPLFSRDETIGIHPLENGKLESGFAVFNKGNLQTLRFVVAAAQPSEMLLRSPMHPRRRAYIHLAVDGVLDAVDATFHRTIICA